MSGARPHLPQQALIDSYGNGGFRFAGMSHRGSLLSLPSGVWSWDVRAAQDIDEAALAPVRDEAERIDMLLIGSGAAPWALPEPLRQALREWGVSAEATTTGSAVRTYNIVLGEGRRVAAALIAVA